MKIQKSAMAGTLESSDLLVRVEPDPSALTVEISSIVKERFGELIREEVYSVLRELDVTEGSIFIDDRGALDCVIKARVETAIRRAGTEG